MSKQTKEKELAPLSLFEIYKTFPFEWSLVTNFIRWQSGSELLLGDIFRFENGDQMINQMEIEAFEDRVQALHDLKVDGKPFKVTYTLYTANDQACQICEQGQLINAPQGYPIHFQGTLEILREPVPLDSLKKGRPRKKDTLTGCLHKQELVKILENGLTDTQRTTPTVFINVRVNRLMQIGLQYGLQESRNVFKRVAQELKGALRIGDHLGRISGNSLGIILENCDQKEIVAVAKRIVEAIEFAGIRAHNSNVPVQISIGGTLIPQNDKITPEMLIMHSSKVLMDAVNIKKIALPTADLSQRIGVQGEENPEHNRRKQDQG